MHTKKSISSGPDIDRTESASAVLNCILHGHCSEVTRLLNSHSVIIGTPAVGINIVEVVSVRILSLRTLCIGLTCM